MARFDIIESAGKSYKMCWDQRAYLVRLAAVPLLMKLICWNMVVAMGWEQDFTKQAMVMLPSYFADGWMVSHFVRLVFFGQKWPFKPTGDVNKDMEVLQDRALGIMRGTLCFVVIKYLLAGFQQLVYITGVQQQEQAEVTFDQEPTFTLFFGGLGLIAFFIWFFRYFWFYIPAAINHPLRSFDRKIRPFAVSFYIIGVWLVCFMPLMLFFNISVDAFFGGAAETADQKATARILTDTLGIFFDTAILLTTTGGVAFGFGQILIDKGKNKPKLDKS